MRIFIIIMTSLFSTLAPLLSGGFYQFEVGRIAISSPKEGDVLQGVVEILGSTDIENFERSTLHFSIQDDPTGTWFLISESTLAIDDGQLALWDTSKITDGTYSIRLTVIKLGNEQETLIVDNLRVRNYTAIETDTPSPFISTLATPTPVKTQTPRPATPTHLPENPAELMYRDVWQSLFLGATLVGVIAILTMVFLTMRRKHHG